MSVAEAQISDQLAEKAHDLVEGNAVALVVGYENRAAVVNGGTAWYVVKAYPDGLQCDCEAGSAPWCSHRLACAIVWAEALSDPFSGVT